MIIDEIRDILLKYLTTDKNNELFFKWYEIVEEIVNHEEIQKRNSIEHHKDQSVFVHSVIVSFSTYLLATKKKCSEKQKSNVAIAGMLHDFYIHAWRETPGVLELGAPYADLVTLNIKPEFFYDKHAFRHPKEALENSIEFFPHLINEEIADAILYHMYPLTKPLFKSPKYIEGKLLTLVDKKVSLNVLTDFKEIPLFLGLKKKNG